MKKFALLLLLATAACDKEEDRPISGVTTGFSHTFILGYEFTDRYYIHHFDHQWLEIYIDYHRPEGYYHLLTPDLHAGTPSEEVRKQFQRLSERNGDTSYNQQVWYVFGQAECWADNFLRIEVVCTNRDIDAAHPAGTPLNDLLIANTYTCGPYVRSGYQGEEWRVVEKPLPEMKPEDLEMISIGSRLAFRFASPSDLSGSYDLQATLFTTDGKEKLATGTVEFPYTPSM